MKAMLRKLVKGTEKCVTPVYIVHTVIKFLFHIADVFMAPEGFFVLTGHVLLRRLYIRVNMYVFIL